MSSKNVVVLSLIAASLLGLGLWRWQARSANSDTLHDPSGAVAGAQIPGTPAGRALAAYFKSFNTGDLEVLRRFIADHFSRASLARVPLDERAINDALVYKDTQGLELFSIEQSSDYSIMALVQARLSEAWFRVTLDVAPEEPHEINSLRTMLSARPAAAPANRRLSDAEVVRELESYMSKLVAADAFSGAVLLAKGGQPLFAKAYGIANRTTNAANCTDTLFNIGSMNKMFTAVAVAQLAQRGLLSFDDTIAKHIPEYPNKEVAAKVKLFHLLTHTSGLGDFFGPRLEASRTSLRKIKDFIPLFADDPLSFEPGSRFQYSNAGYIVLGWVIEKVSRQDYFDYVREHVYKPARMDHTDAYEARGDLAQMAVGYTAVGSDGRRHLGPRGDNLGLHLVSGTSAGGGFSTVGDLLKFDVALRGHKLLGPEMTEQVLSGKVARDGEAGVLYALGFMDSRFNGSRIVGHGGGFPGINAQLDMYLDLGYTVAVASNYDPPTATVVADKLRELLTRK